MFFATNLINYFWTSEIIPYFSFENGEMPTALAGGVGEILVIFGFSSFSEVFGFFGFFGVSAVFPECPEFRVFWSFRNYQKSPMSPARCRTSTGRCPSRLRTGMRLFSVFGECCSRSHVSYYKDTARFFSSRAIVCDSVRLFYFFLGPPRIPRIT